MKIRHAKTGEEKVIAAQYEELLRYEEAHGTSSNWVRGIYPLPATAENALRAGTLFVAEDNGSIVGSMVLNQRQAPEYREVPWRWQLPPSEITVVHTLCIPPRHCGKGRGKQMISFAKGYATAKGCRGIRLDTWEHNAPAIALYEACGFLPAGKVLSALGGTAEQQILLHFECQL